MFTCEDKMKKDYLDIFWKVVQLEKRRKDPRNNLNENEGPENMKWMDKEDTRRKRKLITHKDI